MSGAKRAALYLRVSSTEQNCQNQEQRLLEVAERCGWQPTVVYEDAGISGSKSKEKRPGLAAALKGARRREYDILMVWSVDRLGRSLIDLIETMNELHAAGIDLYLDQQGVDTTTPAGRVMFSVLGAFAEFERSILIERTRLGLARAKRFGTSTGRAIGRPTVPRSTHAAILRGLADGTKMVEIAATNGVSTETVRRIKLGRHSPVRTAEGRAHAV